MNRGERLRYKLRLELTDPGHIYAPYVRSAIYGQLMNSTHLKNYGQAWFMEGGNKSLQADILRPVENSFMHYHVNMAYLQSVQEYTSKAIGQVIINVANHPWRPPHIVAFRESMWIGPHSKIIRLTKTVAGHRTCFRPGMEDIIKNVYVVGEGSWAAAAAGEIRRLSRRKRFTGKDFSTHEFKKEFLRDKCLVMTETTNGNFITVNGRPLNYLEVGEHERLDRGYRIGGITYPPLSANMVEVEYSEIPYLYINKVAENPVE